MQVTLAGYNLDREIIDRVGKIIDGYPYRPEDFNYIKDLLICLADESLTPETLSAAYARISRSDKGITELRRIARGSVSRARRTNERIVFGLGHASIAEHAVINLDITDISRLALEELESHRLASYTEASQRYIAMSGDFIIPYEIITAGLEDRFRKDCETLFSGYRDLINMLEQLLSDLPDQDRNMKAREDARYVLPLACKSQVGVTINARIAEWMICNFNRSPLNEIRELGHKMLTSIKRIMPSLIRYTQPNRSLDAAQGEIAHISCSLVPGKIDPDSPAVELIEAPESGENNALAAMLFNAGAGSYSDCLESVKTMNEEEKKKLLVTAHKCISAHEPLRREMELGCFTFSITLSSSAFAQFKRHRIATLIKQNYQPGLRVIIPPNILEVKGEKLFNHCIDISNSLYSLLKEKLEDELGCISQYALTNAHRRRIVFQANARELTHLSRLREDINAQWDIRQIAKEMIRKAREACPALMLFTAGKDTFDKLSEELFGE